MHGLPPSGSACGRPQRGRLTVPPPVRACVHARSAGGARARASRGQAASAAFNVSDSRSYHKLTAGVTMEKLADAIWGRRRAHRGEGVAGFWPPPHVHWHPSGTGWPLPRDAAECARLNGLAASGTMQ